MKRLVSIISTGSRMYSLHLDQTHSPESPLPNGDVPRLSAVENFKIRGGVGLDVQVDVPASYTLGSDIIYHGREDFARSCFAFLFDLCSGIVIGN